MVGRDNAEELVLIAQEIAAHVTREAPPPFRIP